MRNLESCIALACIEFGKTKKVLFYFQIGVMRDNADRLNESWHGMVEMGVLRSCGLSLRGAAS